MTSLPVGPQGHDNEFQSARRGKIESDTMMDIVPPSGDFIRNDRYTNELPARPSSRTSFSSMGSGDSGISFPPGTGQKKKKVIRRSKSDMERWIRERAEEKASVAWKHSLLSDPSDTRSHCQHCNCQFDTLEQLQNHWGSQHRGTYGWSCQELPVLIEYPVNPKDMGEYEREEILVWHSHCQLCDEVYAECPNDSCELHGRHCAEYHQLSEHHVGRCGVTEGFYSAEEFRQHLFDAHLATSSSHLQNILDVCQLEAEYVASPEAYEAGQDLSRLSLKQRAPKLRESYAAARESMVKMDAMEE